MDEPRLAWGSQKNAANTSALKPQALSVRITSRGKLANQPISFLLCVYLRFNFRFWRYERGR